MSKSRAGGRGVAIQSGHRALGATVVAVWREAASYKTLPPIKEVDIPLPTGTLPLPPAPRKFYVFASGPRC